jgi:hypothetical protein
VLSVGFGMDELLPEARQEVATAIDAGASAIVLFWGDPRPFVEDAHRAGVKVASTR